MSKNKLDYYLKLEYDVIIHKEEMDGDVWFTAYSKELGKLSCYGKGDTPAEALESFNKEKDYFITYLFENGKEIPEPNCIESQYERYSGAFNVRTSPIIHAKLVEQASEMDISMNLYINQILAATTERKEFDRLTMRSLNELHIKLDNHHYEVTRQLKYQTAINLEHNNWHAEYRADKGSVYLAIAV